MFLKRFSKILGPLTTTILLGTGQGCAESKFEKRKTKVQKSENRRKTKGETRTPLARGVIRDVSQKLKSLSASKFNSSKKHSNAKIGKNLSVGRNKN